MSSCVVRRGCVSGLLTQEHDGSRLEVAYRRVVCDVLLGPRGGMAEPVARRAPLARHGAADGDAERLH